MSDDSGNFVQRQMDLLKKLGRGVRRASELETLETPAPSSPKSRRGRAAPLTQWMPHAELVGELDGARLWRVVTRACCDGTPTRQGYRCPVADWSGPPAMEWIAHLTGEPDWRDLPHESIVFLDTETTGLSTGAGSLAFLDRARTLPPTAGPPLRSSWSSSILMTSPPSRCWPEAVDDRAAPGRGRSSNLQRGRSTCPLMAARWVLARRPPRFPELHLDLLAYTRRLWRMRLESCSLGSIESHVLRLRRMSDMPGSMIPGIWLEAQRGIQPERLVPVFDHHAQDIYSLAALTAVLALAMREPDHAILREAEVQWGLARLAESRGDLAAAAARLESAVLAARSGDLEFQLAMQLARTYRRLGRMDEALAIWRARVPHCRPDRLDPLIELAKYAEHVQKDLEAARRWTERALELLRAHDERAWYLGAGRLDAQTHQQTVAALEHRLARHSQTGRPARPHRPFHAH